VVVDHGAAGASAVIVHRDARDGGDVVYTHNLAIGVLVGVLLSGIFFAGKIAQLFVQALDMAILKFRRTGAEVEVIGHERGV
jgi:hypothetical protein